jgi:hypothetical protein
MIFPPPRPKKINYYNRDYETQKIQCTFFIRYFSSQREGERMATKSSITKFLKHLEYLGYDIEDRHNGVYLAKHQWMLDLLFENKLVCSLQKWDNTGVKGHSSGIALLPSNPIIVPSCP